MTKVGLQWQELQETKRSNLAREAETMRANQAKELETNRSNLAQEAENSRFHSLDIEQRRIANELTRQKQETIDLPVSQANIDKMGAEERKTNADTVVSFAKAKSERANTKYIQQQTVTSKTQANRNRVNYVTDSVNALGSLAKGIGSLLKEAKGLKGGSGNPIGFSG